MKVRMSSLELSADTKGAPQENPSKVVWALAWPAVVLNGMQVLNMLLDSAFIGRLESAALLAYGALTNVLFLLFSLAMALATAATALVSRAYGAGQVEEFRMASRQALSVTLACGTILAILGASLSPAAAQAFLPAGETRAESLMLSYLAIYSFGLPAIYLIQSLAGAMRGVGDTRSPMVISGIQILLHIALNLILIFPPRDLGGGLTLPGYDMGLAGGALALTISAWMAAVGYLLYAGRTALGSVWRLILPSWVWVVRIFRIAIPAAIMALLRVSSLAVFTIVLKYAKDASDAIAGMRPGFAIESMMFMPSFGLAMAAAALVGQSLGAKNPDRAERLAWTAAHHAAIVTALLALPIFLGADGLANLLAQGKPSIAAETALLLRYLCVTEVGFAYAMVMMFAMQGAGDTVRPMWITVITLWGMRVPLTWLLALPLGLGSTGAWIAMSVTQLLQGLFAVLAFRQGKWKHKEV